MPSNGYIDTGKQFVLSLFLPWQRSSAAEQGTHKPKVTGSNPVAATTDRR